MYKHARRLQRRQFSKFSFIGLTKETQPDAQDDIESKMCC